MLMPKRLESGKVVLQKTFAQIDNEALNLFFQSASSIFSDCWYLQIWL